MKSNILHVHEQQLEDIMVEKIPFTVVKKVKYLGINLIRNV